MTRINSAGVIGAGVIGSGWIARFLLNGIDVAVYDPSKDAPKNVNKVIQNAERAYAQLLACDLPKRGTLTFENSVSDASKSADIIDRKSTRLNSSHVVISYAVFCLKKKKLQEHIASHTCM